MSKEYLTGIIDADTLILKQLSIKEINRYCTASKYVSKACHSAEFWIEKLKYDELPFNIITVIPTTYQQWIKMYKILSDVKFIATVTLLVTGIEYTRVDDKMKGIIYIDMVDTNLLQYVLPDTIYNDLNEYISKYNIWRLTLTYINDNTYDMVITGANNVTNKVNKNLLTIQLDYDDIFSMIMKCHYSNYTDGSIASVRDEYNRPLFVTSSIINRYIPTMQNPIYLYKRLSIWDTMNYIRNNQ